MATATIQQKRHRAPLGVYHDDDGTRAHRLNLPAEDRAQLLFKDLIHELEAIRAEHDLATTDEDVCDCDLCYDIQAILWSVEVFESALQSCLLSPTRSPVELLASLQEAATRYPAPPTVPIARPLPPATPLPRPAGRPYWEAT